MVRRRAPRVIKNVIAPVQAWLMSRGRCVGCGRDLAKGKSTKNHGGKKVACSCGRIFVHEKNDKWRRALLEEV